MDLPSAAWDRFNAQGQGRGLGAEDDGTRVDVESAFHAKGLMRLVAPLFVPGYERGWARGKANLKRMMQSGEL